MRISPLSISMVLAGCVGRLADPGAFFDAELAFPCEITDEQVVTDIIQPRCLTSGCHDRLGRAGDLDLETHDAPGRLLGAPSTCEEMPLLDAQTPFAGYLFEKLGDAPTCGVSMPPLGKRLSDQEKSCIHRWMGRPWAEAFATEEAP